MHVHVFVKIRNKYPYDCLVAPAFSNHDWLYHDWSTTAYYNYYFDIYSPYLLKDLRIGGIQLLNKFLCLNVCYFTESDVHVWKSLCFEF